jgi:succinate dehydrogenase/fumarate reductase flavoprotein subunit
VAHFNTYAAKGEDPDFARGADAHSRFRGDQENKPNPSLGPILKPPFYAIVLTPGDLSSVAGLNTDEKARVLDKAGQVIPGLYAVGLDMNSMTRGLYPAGGSSLGPALTFGYIAARDMAVSAGLGTGCAHGREEAPAL